MTILTHEEVVRELERAAREVGGQSEWARRNGVSFKWVNNVINGHTKPSIGIASKLGFRRRVVWERVET